MTTRNCSTCLYDSIISDVRGYDCGEAGNQEPVIAWCEKYAYDGMPPLETEEACPGWADGEDTQ